MPPEIANASTEFMELLSALKERAWLETHNQCYAMLRATLHEFRDYMTLDQAIVFAGALPPVTRAIFVEDWTPSASPSPPPDPEAFAAALERRLAPHHYCPDGLAEDVFAVLAPRCDQARIGLGVEALPAGLQKLWRGIA